MSSAENKKKSGGAWKTIFRREFKSFYLGWVSWVVAVAFLLLNGFMFFTNFFLNNMADMRQFFSFLPIAYSFFIPALTMHLFSEERRVGSFETLLTLPVSTGDIVIGKYLASLVSSLLMLSPTLIYVITVYCFGTPDAGPVLGGYIGAVFLVASYTAIGVFASSISPNQIISFIISLAICLFLSFVDWFSFFMPASIVRFVSFISARSHFASISRGVVDSRDVIYFLSIVAVFMSATVMRIKKLKEA